MSIETPCGNLRVAAGTQSIATGAAAVKATFCTGNVGLASVPFNGNSVTGDPSVIPDILNDRIKVNSPGIYEVSFSFSCNFTVNTAYTFQLRKNGVAIPGAVGSVSINNQPQNNGVGWSGIVPVTSADGAAAALQTFADPATTTADGHYDFSGAGAAPKTVAYFDIVISSTITGAVVIQNGDFMVERLQ